MQSESDEQQALALLQKEMLAFILEGVTERIASGEAPPLANAVTLAIATQVKTAIESSLRGFNLPTATQIAEEVVRIARNDPAGTLLSNLDIESPNEKPEVQDKGVRGGWFLPTIWVVPLILLVGLTAWLAWQKSNAFENEWSARTSIAVERDSLSGEICKSAKAQQEQLALLRNTTIYKTNCPSQPNELPSFCQAVDALDRASKPPTGCSGH